MNDLCRALARFVFTGLVTVAIWAEAAPVEPGVGYTNDFATLPAASDWSTLSIGGGGNDAYDLNDQVRTTIGASAVTNQLPSEGGNPAGPNALATWSSSGLHVQTRPTGNRYTLLMGTFVNNTETNATEITVSYTRTVAQGGGSEDEDKGTRLYYSVGGGTLSWSNVAALNTLLTANGSTTVGTNISVNWSNGATLYLLWADDNAALGTDAGYQMDDFSLRVTGGNPVSTALRIALGGPTNNALFVSGDTVTAVATPTLGTGPYQVEYFTNSGVGNALFQSAGSVSIAPFELNLGQLPAGTYNIYAVATDAASAVTNTVTNAFVVADPITFTLSSPPDNTTVDHVTSVIAAANVSGGTPPYAVQFLVDDLPRGEPITSAPYELDLGPLFVGNHTISARVTDAHGWTSNSAIHSIHVTGPLGVALTPTNGASYSFGAVVDLVAAPGGGTSPYSVSFYNNEQLVGSASAPPYTITLIGLGVGSYTSYVHAVDNSSPVAESAYSTTNVFTVLPNPAIVAVTNPTNSQTVPSGQAVTVRATAAIGAPLTVTNVQFFIDGMGVAADDTEPYVGSVSNITSGPHTIYAAATDNLGRTFFSPTNQFNGAFTGPPPNDAFGNAIVLTGPIVRTTGHNFNATKQFGQEPTFIGGNFGGGSVWWSWTAVASGQTTIDTSGSEFNTLLGVFTGNAGNQLTLVADNNDYLSNTWSRVQFNAVAGTTYRIVVDGLAAGGFPPNPARGIIRLNINGQGALTITTPTNGMTFTLGQPIPVNVTIATNFPNLPLQRVDFYRAGAVFASSTTAPFSAIASNAPLSTNSFFAVAVDSTGLSVTSSVVNVLVLNVGVTLLQPPEGTVYLNTNSITMLAAISLLSGTMTNVEFFVDGVKVAQDSTAPFSAPWTNVTPGAHRLTAVGWSSDGASYNSQGVNIAVAAPLLPFRAVWKYLDNGSDQGTSWIAPDFDDSTWASGPAEFGYGDLDEATVVSFGPDNNEKYITTYFRRPFVVTNPAVFTSIIVSLERDDGGVVYLNGQEIFRSANMPPAPAPITFVTTATTAVDDVTDNVTLSVTDLLPGTNVMAVEIHQQSANSSDLSFNLQVLGVVPVIRNLAPMVAINSPTNDAHFAAPPSVTIEATAIDSEGSVAKVEFYADGVKLGEVTETPHTFIWDNPSIGAHVLTVVATDDEGASRVSAPVVIGVYDAAETPIAEITIPADGAVMQGPTNVLVTATASAVAGVTNVQFLANGVAFANAGTPPYSAVWSAPFGTNTLTAIVSDANGVHGTSAVVTVVITIPPTNLVAPTVAARLPALATVSNLTSITVVFSELVQNVDAGDLLINGTPATGVSANNSRSNYVFTFLQPAYGLVNISWASGHGITDYGWPTVLPFNENGAGATWSYDLIDRTSPTIAARSPAAGATVTSVQQINVTFSEAVTGVDASDLLVNGAPPFAMSGSGDSYTFLISQPASGPVSITWALNHGITDLASTPNTFNRNTGAWSFTLDARTPIVQSNANWRFLKGTNEASSPVTDWRQLAFNDSGWSNAPSPFFVGDTGYTNAAAPGTALSDMQGNYSSVFLRTEFQVLDLAAITNLFLRAQSDDGFIAWLNGVEVARFNMPTGQIAYNATASTPAPEPQNNGAAWNTYALTNGPSSLVTGANVLAVQAFNQSLAASGDFGFNAQLYAYLPDFSLVVPYIAEAQPASGDILFLTNVVFTFSEAVTGVDAGDVLINGQPAAAVSETAPGTYTFSFTQPPYGPVTVNWIAEPGIVDLDTPPKPFNASGPNTTLSYTLINPSNPRVESQMPVANAVITNLTEITVTFTEPVSGVEAADLLLSGVPASTVTPLSEASYRFSFPQPAFGNVTVRWVSGHGITDREEPANAFDPARFGGQWDYTLVDPVPRVEIVSPAEHAAFLVPGTIPITATASDNDGVIVRVEFFEDGARLGEATNAPYSLIWSNVPLGEYVLRAVATDDSGHVATSFPVTINVVTSLPIALLRGPYLQIGTPTSGLIRWRTDIEADSVVFYGKALNALTNVASDSEMKTEHEVRISDLEPDTQYYYSIGSSDQMLAGGPNYWFKTSPVHGTPKPTRIWVLGDAGTAGNGSPDRQRSTRDAFYNYAATNGRPADIWLMLGDNAYDRGLDDEHQRAVFDMYPATLRNLFLWPALGNHETSQSTTLETFPYLDIFSLPRNGEAGGVPSGTEKYYSFDYANIHFICLDSMTSGRTATSPMAQWLQDDLAATSQEWIIVFFHHPPYTKGSHDSDSENDLVQIRQNIVPILESNGVDIVLGGHSHCYERSYLLHGQYGLSSTLTAAHKLDGGDGRIDGTGAYRKDEQGHGVVYTVAGSSGQATFGSLNHPAHFVSLLELGSMVIDVTSNRLDGAFIHADGRIRDRFTLLKRADDLPPPAPVNLLAIALGTNEISLSWTDTATNETGFAVERSIDGTNFTALLTTSANLTNLVDSGLAANTTYHYRVRTVTASGESDFSNTASATTVGPSSTPAAPSDLVAAADNGAEFYRSHIVLRWRDRSANEGGFLIERSTDGVDFTAISSVGANVTRFRDSGLDSASAYFYRVRSFNSSGNSAPSNLAGDQTHPQTDVVVIGATAVFHGGVEGQPFIQYQWRFEGTAISGATNETLVLENVIPSDEGAYTVDLIDAEGRTTSNPAYLYVIAGPMIVMQPVSRTNIVGSTAIFSVVAAGDAPLTYQWRRNGQPIADADETSLVLEGVQLTHQGSYDVIVANDFGSTTSQVAQLVVNLPPVATADIVFRWRGENIAIEISDLLANDFDPDGDPITLGSVTTNSAQNGSVSIMGRYVIYDPPVNFEAADSFVYSIVDNRGGIAAAQVSIEISSNTPPVFVPVPDLVASVLSPVIITNAAADADEPANNLSYSLVSPSLANARLDASEGLFIWTPMRQHGPSTNVVTLSVRDDGRPALSNSQSFTIVVRDYVELTAGTSVVIAGQNGSVPLEVFSSAGLTRLQLALKYAENRLSDWTIEPLSPALTDATVQSAGPGEVLLTFNAKGAQTLQGTQQLARLHFTATAGQSSNFLPLTIQEVACDRAQPGLEPSALMNDGRVVVVGSDSLLEALLNAGGERHLVIYGPAGSYTVETTVDPTAAGSWTTWQQVTTTSMAHTVPIPSNTAKAFYRLRRAP